MILIKIKKYIDEQKEVTLPHLAAHFQMPESVIEMMTDHWIQKGAIEKITVTCESFNNNSECGGCSKQCITQAIKNHNKNSQVIYRPL